MVPVAKKNHFFSKYQPKMPKQVLLGCFEPVVNRCGPPKSPKDLKMGHLETKKVPKMRFSKIELRTHCHYKPAVQSP